MFKKFTSTTIYTRSGFNIWLVPAFLLMFSSCISSKKHFEKGRYDQAIQVSVRKLKKNPNNPKQALILEKSMKLANQKDNEQLSYLQLEGNPDRWDEVYNIYMRLKRRQTTVHPVLPIRLSSGREIKSDYINYDEEIVAAKNKAAEFYYTRGSSLLEENTRGSAREAYADFMNVKKFYRDFRDVDQKIAKAIEIGTSYALFKMQNTSGIPLPQNFEKELTAISLHDLNSQWLNYHTVKVGNSYYDYFVDLNIQNIMVSPEELKEIHFSESKEVQDGFQYLFDDKGNVMKDTLGNDIKAPKYKTIVCNLIETQQKKTAKIVGRINFIDNQTGQLIKSDPIATDFFFDHYSLVAVGDINALAPETKKRLGNKPMPFPPDPEMIMQAGNIMKGMAKNILYNNRRVFY